MALAGYPKTYSTPKIHHAPYSGGNVTVTGAIDLIKFVSFAAAGTVHSNITYWTEGEDTSTGGTIVEMSPGDILEGPFIQVTYTKAASSGGTNDDTLIYERSGIE